MKSGRLKKMHNWHYTVDEYIAFERFNEARHEFYKGDIRAMAGGTPEHARLAASLTAQLVPQLRGRGCKVFSCDLRIRPSDDVITYPDLSVACGDPQMDAQDKLAMRNPTVLFEVTSPSSEEYDREGKFEVYQQIASLREYVLISQRERLVEIWRRADDGEWYEAQRASAGERAELTSIRCVIDIDELYRDD